MTSGVEHVSLESFQNGISLNYELGKRVQNEQRQNRGCREGCRGGRAEECSLVSLSHLALVLTCWFSL